MNDRPRCVSLGQLSRQLTFRACRLDCAGILGIPWSRTVRWEPEAGGRMGLGVEVFS